MFFIALFCFQISFGQNKVSVSGTVLDSKTKEPLIGASVVEKGTTNGLITDIDGKFLINTTPNATLVISYMSYKSAEVSVKGKQSLTISLEEDNQLLDEVIVIGYGVQKKSDVTGSISSISGKDINDVPVSSALQALQGKATGVNIIQNSGSPGGKTTIKIRGTGTINDADPLYVVDGFIVDGIDHLNPNDIANMEIFKDAASSAVYGARAANGVVVVTTKSGEKGAMKISFDNYWGVSNPWKTIPVMNTEQYALMSDYINGLTTYSVDGQLYYSKDKTTQDLYFDDYKYFLVDTIRSNSPSSWWDAITQTGFKQQYNLSVSGGSDKNKFMVSASFYDEEGIVRTSEYQRFNTRINLNNQLTKAINLTTSITYANEDRHIVPDGSNSILKQALYQNPMIYTYDSKGYYSADHPIAILDRNHNEIEKHRIDINMSLTAQLSKLLTYQFKVSDYFIPETRSDFTEVKKLNEDFLMTDLSTVYRRQNMTYKWEVNNLLTFAWKKDIHDITVLGGQTAERYNYSWQESTRKGTPSNDPESQFLSSAYTGDKTFGLKRQWSALGFIGRLNYNVRDCYLLQMNFRADGSSIFRDKKRWGFFPSVSLGWKFSSESFMEQFQWLSLGKLRVGWGKLGNNRIDEMSRYTLLNSQYNYPYGIGSHIISPGITGTTIGNPDISWEETETANIGLDLGLFNNALTLSLEFFNKETSDMLIRVPTVLSAGLDDAPMTNAGSVRNRGAELSVNYKQYVNKFRYEVGFNISYIQNEVTKLGTGNEPIYGSKLNESSIADYVTKTAVGKPIGSYFGYVTDGIFNTYEEVKASAQYEYGKNDLDQITRPGDFRFKDLNGDGRITAEDRTYLGSPLPDLVFGIPVSFSYANFDLNIFFQGQTGNKIFNVMDYYLNNAAGSNNLYADIRNKHWSGQLAENRAFFPKNLNATIPDLDPTDATRNFRASDFFVKDGSYIRLKELRLTYNFDQKLISSLHLSNLAIFLGGYNLLTFTKYNGFDPEVGKVSGTEGNNLSMGVDHGNYPQSRTFTMGFKIVL